MAVGSPPVRTRYSCPAAALAGAAMADAAAADSADAAFDFVDVAVIGDRRVFAAAVAIAVPDVVVLRRVLPILPDSAVATGVYVVGAVGFLEHS